MTRTTRALVAFLLAAAVAAPLAAQTATLRLPPAKKTRLKNGLTLILMEQHEMPIVSFSIVVRGGAVADPAGKEGLASLTAGLLRRGTKTRSADQFATELDTIGGTFGADASIDATSISAEFLKKDLAKGLDLVSDAVLRPTFPADEVDKLVKQSVDAITSAKDQAQGVLGTYFNAYLYGAHPYGRPVDGTETSLASLRREDVVRCYESAFAPANTILAVVGDFSAAEMEKQIVGLFGSWSAKASAPITVPAPRPAQGRRLLLVDKPDATQTFFGIGNVGISRTDPDRVPIAVVNTLFGGRFTSMINTELRIKSGLTYGAGSSFSQWRAAGPFAISSYTRNSATEQALDKTLDVLKRLREQGVSQADLDSAKAYVKGQYPPRIETTDQLASLLTSLELYGLDEREVNDYYAKIDAVTMADVARVIKDRFPLDNLVFVLIGKASEIDAVAKKYAPTQDRKSITATGF